MNLSRPQIFDYGLWCLQWGLALFFIWAGCLKWILPTESLTNGLVPLPLYLVRIVGILEILGGIGLVLPWLLRVLPYLTLLAALGLTILMCGAVVIVASSGLLLFALFPATIGAMTAVVMYFRWRSSK